MLRGGNLKINCMLSLSLNEMYLLAFNSIKDVKFLFVYMSLSSHQTLRPVNIYFKIVSHGGVHQKFLLNKSSKQYVIRKIIIGHSFEGYEKYLVLIFAFLWTSLI